jgi:hypothetical protein
MLTQFFGAGRRAADSSSADGIVQLYQSQRGATRRLMHEAMQLLTKNDLEQSAKALGLWRRGVVVLDHEDLSGVMMNYALLEIRHEGLTTVERFRADHSLYDPDEAATVDLLCRAQFRLLAINRLAGNACLEATDQLTCQSGTLVDMNLGKTGAAGIVLATHVWDLADGYWMTTGASVAYSKAAEQLVARRIRSICRCKLTDWPKLGPRQRSAVTALVTRCSIDAGSAERLHYA